MTCSSRIAIVLLTIGIAQAPAVVDGEPIRVTAGTVIGDRRDLLMSVTGEGGLMLNVDTDRDEGLYALPEACGSCLPGTAVPLDIVMLGGWGGTGSFAGVTFEVGSAFSENEGGLVTRFDGELTLPGFAGNQFETVARRSR